MTSEDLKIYLIEMSRILSSKGEKFTTFVEDRVPDITLNPDSIMKTACHRPLHVVRYNKDFLLSIISKLRYHLNFFSHRSENNGQGELYFSKKGDIICQ